MPIPESFRECYRCSNCGVFFDDPAYDEDEEQVCPECLSYDFYWMTYDDLLQEEADQEYQRYKETMK